MESHRRPALNPAFPSRRFQTQPPSPKPGGGVLNFNGQIHSAANVSQNLSQLHEERGPSIKFPSRSDDETAIGGYTVFRRGSLDELVPMILLD